MSTLRCFDPMDLMRAPLDRQSGGPSTMEALLAHEYLVLAHHTSSSFLSSILARGVVPDSTGLHTVDDGLPSDPEAVYLAVGVDRYYHERAAAREPGSTGITLEVRVARALLRADQAAVPPASVCDDWNRMLFLSLSLGACAHCGAIPPSQILGIYDELGTQIGGA